MMGVHRDIKDLQICDNVRINKSYKSKNNEKKLKILRRLGNPQFDFGGSAIKNEGYKNLKSRDQNQREKSAFTKLSHLYNLSTLKVGRIQTAACPFFMRLIQGFCNLWRHIIFIMLC